MRMLQRLRVGGLVLYIDARPCCVCVLVGVSHSPALHSEWEPGSDDCVCCCVCVCVKTLPTYLIRSRAVASWWLPILPSTVVNVDVTHAVANPVAQLAPAHSTTRRSTLRCGMAARCHGPSTVQATCIEPVAA